MGQFSWITQDTDEPVFVATETVDSTLSTAYMHDNKGNTWYEASYEGYGVFGGKDFYQLLAEMNDIATGDIETDRDLGIALVFGDNEFISPNITRYQNWTWVNFIPESDPNQGWFCDDEDDEDYDDDYWY